MDKKYKNKYRIESTRLQNWDYRWSGVYFITVCTKNKKYYFGDVVNGKMMLSKIGVITNILWYEISNHANNIELGEFIVMPNHIHGILILDDIDNGDDIDNVETRHALSLQSQSQSIGQQRFQNQGKNTISSIIGGYKSAVTKHAHRLGFDFSWQPRFYDHIISNEKSFEKISEYIFNNLSQWENDKLNPIN